MSLNPNGRIPAIIDPAGLTVDPSPYGNPVRSSSIWPDKTGQFISTEPGQRYETLAWVFFQMSAIGPMFVSSLLPCDLAARTMRTKASTALYRRIHASAGDSGSPAGRSTGSSTTIRSRTSRRSAG